MHLIVLLEYKIDQILVRNDICKRDDWYNEIILDMICD